MTDTDPLHEQEQRYLPSGVRVARGVNAGSCMFEIQSGDDIIDLEDEEIRKIAEMAGYTVSDEHERHKSAILATYQDTDPGVAISVLENVADSVTVEHVLPHNTLVVLVNSEDIDMIRELEFITEVEKEGKGKALQQ